MGGYTAQSDADVALNDPNVSQFVVWQDTDGLILAWSGEGHSAGFSRGVQSMGISHLLIPPGR